MTNAVISLQNEKVKVLKERELSDNTGSPNMVFGVFKNRFICGHEKLYEEVEEYPKESLRNKVFKYINQGHTVFTHNFRSALYGESKDYDLKGFGMVRHLSFQDDFNDEGFYQLAYEYYMRNELSIKPLKNSGKQSLKEYDLGEISKFQVQKIPQEIQDVINSRDINKIEQILTLNSRTGFYEYVENNVSFPIMCRHVFMYLKGISLIDISIECLKNGQCRYCGQEMSNYAEHLVVDVSSAVVSVIYQFFELIPFNFNMTTLYYATIEYLTKTLEKHEINSDKKQQLFTYMFFYSYLQHTSIKFRTSTKKYKYFITDATKIANANGLTVTELKDFRLVDDYTIYDNIIMASAYKNIINYYEMTPLSILFNVDSFTDFSGFNPQNEYQKLFKNNKMIDFNERVDDLIKALFKMVIPNVSLRINFKVPIVKDQERSGVLAVFRNIVKWFCPINIIHDFKNGVCKYCGYDKKNDIEVFHKHPLGNAVNNPSSVTKFKTPDNTIDFKDFNENDLTQVLKGSKYYSDLIGLIGNDLEKDKRIIQDIFGYRIEEIAKKIDKKTVKMFYITYAKMYSNEELESVLMYYYNIGIINSKYSLAALSLEEFEDIDESDSDDEDN